MTIAKKLKSVRKSSMMKQVVDVVMEDFKKRCDDVRKKDGWIGYSAFMARGFQVISDFRDALNTNDTIDTIFTSCSNCIDNVDYTDVPLKEDLTKMLEPLKTDSI